MPWAVKGETADGVLTLRTFDTREEAEDHPVVMSKWKRVWVEEVYPPPPAGPASLRQPWTIEEPLGTSFTYIRDADGSRVCSLFGKDEQRQRLIEKLRGAGLM